MKKVFLTAVCLLLILVSSVNATFAFFADGDGSFSSISVGQVGIEFKDEAEGSNAGNKLLPGVSYAKKPVVRVLEGSEDCWLFIALENGIESIEESGAGSIAARMEENGWLPLDGVEDVYAYEAIVSAGAVLTVFDGFTVSGSATAPEIQSCSGAQIVLTAYAVQAAGFDSAAAAWTAV